MDPANGKVTGLLQQRCWIAKMKLQVRSSDLAGPIQQPNWIVLLSDNKSPMATLPQTVEVTESYEGGVFYV